VTAIPTLDAVDWPSARPIAADRVLGGAPQASTALVHRDDQAEFGLWRVTPGEFTARRAGQTEYITVLSGQGRLIRENGETTELSPGAVTVLADGWSGRWQIEKTLVKSYVLLPTKASGR
jgi:uncharacterized cupin superfamily protein